MTNFSPWCVKCLAGDYRDGVTGSHQLHVAEMRRSRAQPKRELRHRVTYHSPDQCPPPEEETPQ